MSATPTEIKPDDIKNVIGGILKRANDELASLEEEDLEKFWYFQWDSTRGHEWNLYKFTDMLDLYRSQCRRWEEMHNGSCCVVERVRDKYLMPKIRAFLAQQAAA